MEFVIDTLGLIHRLPNPIEAIAQPLNELGMIEVSIPRLNLEILIDNGQHWRQETERYLLHLIQSTEWDFLSSGLGELNGDRIRI